MSDDPHRRGAIAPSAPLRPSWPRSQTSAAGSFIGDHIGGVTTFPHAGTLYVANLNVPARIVRSAGAIMTTPYPRDRPGVVATAILQIVKTIPATDLQELIEAYLRDEFAELDGQVAGGRNSPDA